MLVNSLGQIDRDACINGSILPVRHHVDEAGLHSPSTLSKPLRCSWTPAFAGEQNVHAATNNSLSVLPNSDGLGETVIPAASIAAILLAASPLPPDTIAPAWPIRRPGGAVRPAMNPTTCFLRRRSVSSARNCAASSSAPPPISPIMMIDFVS